jgi:VIT1/CCC1 family predicted Fe2+/Mn2+ transporter
MQFKTAPQDRVDRYPVEVERILQALGYTVAEVAVSDESAISDFSDFAAGFDEAELQRLGAELGIAVQNDSFLADLAAALHTKA